MEADALGAHAALLALPRARRCGGAKKANVGETKVRLLRSGKRQVRMRISFPTPTFSAHQGGSSDYQQMFMEGMGETGEKGRPGLPILTNFLAVPRRARLALRVEKSAGYTLKGVNLFCTISLIECSMCAVLAEKPLLYERKRPRDGVQGHREHGRPQGAAEHQEDFARLRVRFEVSFGDVEHRIDDRAQVSRSPISVAKSMGESRWVPVRGAGNGVPRTG